MYIFVHARFVSLRAAGGAPGPPPRGGRGSLRGSMCIHIYIYIYIYTCTQLSAIL